jgi:hypothetical protein
MKDCLEKTGVCYYWKVLKGLSWSLSMKNLKIIETGRHTYKKSCPTEYYKQPSAIFQHQ